MRNTGPLDKSIGRRQLLTSGMAIGAAALAAPSVLGKRTANLLRATQGTLTRQSTASGTQTFWDLPWGAPTYTNVAKQLVAEYNSTHKGQAQVSYQSISWSNEYQVFSSAFAAGTTPNTSSGPSWLPLQFADEGVAPLDSLVKRLKASGVADDFAGDSLELFKYQGHYLGLPWSISPRVMVYRKSLLEKAGVGVPTTWAELLDACRALKKIGVYGYLTEAGAGAFGFQFFLPLILNNGGGLFNKNQEPDCVTDANLEATEFMIEMSKNGYFDPASVEYTAAEGNAAFGNGKVAMAMVVAGYNTNFSSQIAEDIGVMSPLTSPQGKKGTLYWAEPLVMYKSAGNYDADEEWLTWYIDAMKAYWEQGVLAVIPARKSFAKLPAISDDPFLSVPLNEWMPIAKIDGALSPSGFPALNAMEASTEVNTFTQQVIRGTPSAKVCLQQLQNALEIIVSAVANA